MAKLHKRPRRPPRTRMLGQRRSSRSSERGISHLETPRWPMLHHHVNPARFQLKTAPKTKRRHTSMSPQKNPIPDKGAWRPAEGRGTKQSTQTEHLIT